MGFRLANIDDRAALVFGDFYYDLETASDGALGADPMSALARPLDLAELSASLEGREPTGRLDSVELGAPVPRPEKIFGIGLNYASHASEASMELPDAPLVFAKFPSCLEGPTVDIELRSDRCDYEGELVVVIGTAGKDIAESDAWSHVAGLTVGQDVSDRAVQFASKPPHFDLGKSFDTFGPTGPVVVSCDELPDPASLHLQTSINGEVRQDDTTANFIWSIPTLISYLSRITSLATGDLIFTGTPEGIGAVDGRFLSDGDVITTTIDGIGTMVNRCVRVSDH